LECVKSDKSSKGYKIPDRPFNGVRIVVLYPLKEGNYREQ